MSFELWHDSANLHDQKKWIDNENEMTEMYFNHSLRSFYYRI